MKRRPSMSTVTIALAVIAALAVAAPVFGVNFLTKGKAKKLFYTKSLSDGRYLTPGQADGRYLTPSQGDSRYLTPGQGDSRYLTPDQGDGRYLPGRRSRSWVKLKRFQRAEVVVIGWVPWRNGLSGPLAVGQRIDGGSAQVRFAGVVEAGFSEGDRAELGRRLVDLQDPTARPWREHRGQPLYPVRPELTVEVQLLEWTALGQARHMSYKGIARQ